MYPAMRMCIKILAYVAFSVFVYSILKHISEDQHTKAMTQLNKQSSDQLKYIYYPNFRAEFGDRRNLESEHLINSSYKWLDGRHSSKKYLIYTCSEGRPCGTWADRLCGIFSTYIMATLTNREFILNMTSPCPFKALMNPNAVFWNQQLNKKALSDQVFVDTQNNKTFEKSIEETDLSKLFQNDVVKVSVKGELYSHLKANPLYKYKLTKMFESVPNSPSLIPLLYQRLFTLNDKLQSRVSTFMSKLSANGKRRTLVCFQKRTGFETKPSELTKVWDFMEQFKNINNCVFFVATDSENIQKEAKARFQHQLLDVPGPIIHLDYLYDNQSCAGMSKVILDQYILKFCDALVVSNSGYGQISALLRQSDKDLYQVIDGKVVNKTLSDFSMFVK